jgi:3'-phosphoadenosine 5'-phosphosulfate sulfotransferase (PAPS reductase)/FAD synthetase
VSDIFKIDGPTCISFSGGRTSAYMLYRVLQSNGGKLPDEAVVCFANTGKEAEETLEFVQECYVRWNVPIVWIEYTLGGGVRVVNFETASRKGEPFEALIQKRQYLPNPVARFCTVELKILTAVRYLRGLGWEEWDNLIGMRADEPARVAKVRASPSGGTKGVERHVPLASAGIGVQDVLEFWCNQEFDLGLPVVNGKTMHGNCDLCFLKPPAQRLSLIRERPSRAIWWVAQEASIQSSSIVNGARFSKDGPSYAQMLAYSQSQDEMFDPGEEAVPCFCGD